MEICFEVQVDVICIHFTANYDACASYCVFVNRAELVFGIS